MPTLPRAALGLAALLLVASSLAACGGDDDADGGTETTAEDGTTTDSSSDGAGTTSTTAADGATSSTTSTTEITLDGEATDEAIAVVDRFIAALAAGDAEAAWEVVDERSREAIGGFDRFEAIGTELAEGYGAWAEVEDRRVFVGSVGVVAGATVWPVTLLGEVAQEGPPALAATSLPTRVGPDGITVSPFEDPFGDLGIVSFAPVEGSEIAAGRGVVVGVPVGLTPLLIAVDGVPARTEELNRPDADGDTISHVVADLGVGPGPHAVTVVVADDAGAIAARAAAYAVVEGSSDGDDGDGGDAGLPADPESVARSVFEAWLAGEVASVKDLTNLDVQAVLSARPPAADDGWSAEPICEGTAGSTYCVWDGRGEQLILRVSTVVLGDGSGPPVVEARFEPIA